MVAKIGEISSANLAVVDLSPDGNAKIQFPLTLNPHNQSTTIELFGRSSDAVVKDQEGRLIQSHLRENLMEVDIDSSGIMSATLHYNTSDLTKKYGREWTFSLISPMRTSLILPVDSHISSWGLQNPLLITQGQNRNIIAFDPGNITVKYEIIEQSPTKDEAIISIDSAQIMIQQAKGNNPLIVLASAERTLQQAISAKDEKQYQQAIELGTVAKELLSNVTKEYDSAQSEINKAELLFAKNITDGEVGAYKALLTNAKDELKNGNYTKSKGYIKDLFTKYESGKIGPAEKDLWAYSAVYLYLMLPLVIGVTAVALYVNKKGGPSIFKMTKRSIRTQKKSQKQPTTKDSNTDIKAGPDSTTDNDPRLSLRDTVLSGTALATPHIPDTEKDVPFNIVSILNFTEKAIAERPHLKQEDKQVLRFLAEKDGSAFESELRNKFILPKTTLWRLVKRLERESLVEVSKIGVQNLIRLRYEHSDDNQSGYKNL